VERLLGGSYDLFDILDLQYRISSICSDRSLRDKACALEDARAARFSDLVHHVSPVIYFVIQHSDRMPQQCLARVPSYDILRLLQDICSKSGELPSTYWLEHVEVHWRYYISRGGEACIYPGNLGGRSVVVCEVSKPGDAAWSSPEGRQVIEVSTLATTMQHVNSVHFFVAAD